MQELVSHAERFANQNNVDRNVAYKAFIGAGAEASWGTPGGVKFLFGGEAKATARVGGEVGRNIVSNELYQRAQDYIRSNNLQETAEQATSGFLRSSLDETAGDSSQFRNVISENYNEAKSFERAATDSYSDAERYEAASETVSREGYTANQNWDQSLIEFIANQSNEHGVPIGIGGAASLVTSPSTRDQKTVLRWTDDFVETRIDEIMQNVDPSTQHNVSSPHDAPIQMTNDVIRDHFETGRERLNAASPDPDIESQAQELRDRHGAETDRVKSGLKNNTSVTDAGNKVETVVEERINDDSLDSEYQKIKGADSPDTNKQRKLPPFPKSL